jgi:TATA-box binding protein (TBP) (component of TFIID and TFIIIB)
MEFAEAFTKKHEGMRWRADNPKCAGLSPLCREGITMSRVFALLLLSLVLLPAAAICSDSFTYTTGDMQTERQRHTSTFLTDGSVLLTGGSHFISVSGGTSYLKSAEIYSPSAGTFSYTTGDMQSNRFEHTATLLQNGKTLIAGGRSDNSTYLSSAEIYDPATGLFSYTGSMNSVRTAHTAVLLFNGKVLISGGKSGNSVYLSSAEIYDPETGLFTTVGSMKHVSSYFAATLMPSGEVLVTGGTGYSGTSKYADLYNAGTGVFSSTGALNTNRSVHAITLLLNGKAFVAGGINTNGDGYVQTAEIYSSGAFSSADNSMTSRRGYPIAALLTSGKVLVAGGVSNVSAVASADLYDPSAGTNGEFSSAASMNLARQEHAASVLADGKVLITGGESTDNFSSKKAELYDAGDITCSDVLFDIDGSVGCHTSIHSAYDALSGDGELKIKALELDSDLVLDRGITVTLKGGYTSDFSINNLRTFVGALTVQSGTALVENLIIK